MSLDSFYPENCGLLLWFASIFTRFSSSESRWIAAFGHFGFLGKREFVCMLISHQFRVSSDGLDICSVKAIIIIILWNLISFPIYFNILGFFFLLCCILFCGFHFTEVHCLYLCWRRPIHKRILSSNHVLCTYLFGYLLMYLFLLFFLSLQKYPKTQRSYAG